MADNPSQTKPVTLTADVPVEPTDTPASDIPKPKTIRKEENQMAEVWCEDCPPANSTPVMESISYSGNETSEESTT